MILEKKRGAKPNLKINILTIIAEDQIIFRGWAIVYLFLILVPQSTFLLSSIAARLITEMSSFDYWQYYCEYPLIVSVSGFSSYSCMAIDDFNSEAASLIQVIESLIIKHI